jgi:hypothetical protein
MAAFIMPRPLPPIPPTQAGMRRQQRTMQRRAGRPRARPDSEVRGSVYDWRRHGI